MTDLGLIHNSFAHDNEQQSGAKFPRNSQSPPLIYLIIHHLHNAIKSLKDSQERKEG